MKTRSFRSSVTLGLLALLGTAGCGDGGPTEFLVGDPPITAVSFDALTATPAFGAQVQRGVPFNYMYFVHYDIRPEQFDAPTVEVRPMAYTSNLIEVPGCAGNVLERVPAASTSAQYEFRGSYAFPNTFQCLTAQYLYMAIIVRSANGNQLARINRAYTLR